MKPNKKTYYFAKNGWFLVKVQERLLERRRHAARKWISLLILFPLFATMLFWNDLAAAAIDSDPLADNSRVTAEPFTSYPEVAESTLKSQSDTPTLPSPPQAQAIPNYTDTIDLSTTTTSGTGYTVTGSTPPFTNPNLPVTAPNRALTFTAGADGKAYHIIQSGIRNNPVDAAAPKQDTSIFASISVQAGVNVTVVISSIDLAQFGGIVLTGDAELTLLLDSTSYIRRNITVPANATITIDSLNGSDTTDRLIMPSLVNSSSAAARIGGSGGAVNQVDNDAGTITINGGEIDITARSSGAGIGGGGSGTNGAGNGGTITINGGVISVTQYGSGNDSGTGDSGAGIGGGGAGITGANGGDGGTITINGGTVKIVQYTRAAGIGGGGYGPTGNITIAGGGVDVSVIRRVEQAGAGEGSGIGGGTGANRATREGFSQVTISGGTVRTVTNSVGPGIGITHSTDPINITITGGEGFAKSVSGPGIGPWGNAPQGTAITITGGTVVAESEISAGIGGIVLAQFCLGPDANVKAYSQGSKPAINTLDNSCAGFFVNARFTTALSTTTPTTLDVFSQGDYQNIVKSLSLPATYRSFAYSTDDTAPRIDNVLASDGTKYIGQVVRVFDNNAQIYSIRLRNEYNAHNGNAGDALLPVRLVEVIPGRPFVSDVSFTTAVFHSIDQYIGSGINYLGGGFYFSKSASVDGNGKLKDPDVITKPWSAFTLAEIIELISGLDMGTTYYMQTFIYTSLGNFHSLLVPFTTRNIEVLDLSVTTTNGAGYTVTGVATGLDEYLSRFPASDGEITAPTGILTFGAGSDGGFYRIMQSGVLANPSQADEPKHGTSIFSHIVIQDGQNITLSVESIQLLGSITLEGAATLTLLLDTDTASLANPTDAGNFIHGSIVVPETSPTVAAAITIDAVSGVGALTVVVPETTPDAAGIGGGKTGQSAGVITIADGTLHVTASENGAAIGGGAGGSGIINITGGVLTAVGENGAGIGGGAGGEAATITIAAAAEIKAYSLHDLTQIGSKPAIDADGVGNLGDGYYVNAAFNQPLSTDPVDVYVFGDGYSGGEPTDRIDTLTLPANYQGFAYTTGNSSRVDNLYANLGFNPALERTEHRVIDKVLNSEKPVHSVKTLNAYDGHNPPAAAGSGALHVKLRVAPKAGEPTAENVEKHKADLISTGHDTNGHLFDDGGFSYASALDALGRPEDTIATDLAWQHSSFDPNPVTKNTLDDAGDPFDETAKLTPNTRYYVVTYLRAYVDLYLDIPADYQRIESSTVAEFVTAPHITAGYTKGGNSSDAALVSATFVGGEEPLNVTIYWSLGAIDPDDPNSWTSLDSTVLDYGNDDFSFNGFDDFAVNGLLVGQTYNFLIVAENETGYDSLLLSHETKYVFSFFKVNEVDAPLPDASFSFTKCAEPNPNTACTPVSAAVAVSDSAGLVKFTDIEPGGYQLVETQTQPGYQLPHGHWIITFDPDAETAVKIVAVGSSTTLLPPAFKPGTGDRQGQLLLPNYRQLEIPLLGGSGAIPWTTGGIALLGCAVLYAVLGRSKVKSPLTATP